jgi:iron-sulfur cluster repair protein YtfE (RIC family)
MKVGIRMKNIKFEQAIKENLATLDQYVPVVARVHGNEHPEFHEVHKLYKELAKRVKDEATNRPDLDQVFSKLRELTDNYTIPEGVCESYEAVYNMLKVLDRAYKG